MNINISLVDYTNPQQAQDLAELLDNYARDPMGGGEPLTPEVKANLTKELAKLPHAFSVMACVDGKPAGLINCFLGFSTFAAKPLVNIHDVVVSKDFRGLGLSQKMLEKVEQIARDRNCCKMTLEVLEGNKVAQGSYNKFGFDGYELDPEMGKAVFWQKKL
ncbi:GNAT family N-acetyltransferase [Pragia fontium]|uniref:Acetyltransferase (GNAT) family protein n=2 Tax=Pragia fontium TaxID=82985 RepID=A0AAJ4WAH2_9GAMM|nr:GNAT family N-acetyltransferase [Pragia fontium]AKJ42424.1 GNAT family acetyltransferase [Pragia fontium]SFC78338.1 Acetyltransferase (GNAT) family protein [Pragia fontium DSM 5563 = ATCC 49100]SUB82718.1 putative acetyltransferase [Pragia fontium]VEJ55620.1 putative acetyltransferase [Pragia fontium]GKX61479.1 N-acetyltransferase [Pragia fontium]